MSNTENVHKLLTMTVFNVRHFYQTWNNFFFFCKLKRHDYISPNEREKSTFA